MKNSTHRLSSTQIILILISAVVFGAPAITMIELQIGPGRWMIELQDRFLGGHFIVSSMVILMLFEMFSIGIPLAMVALLVRKLTGKTLLALLRKSK